MKQEEPDWSRPQRQPWEGLIISFSTVMIEVLKRAWWLVLLFIFKDNPEEGSRISRYEIMAIGLAAATFGGALLQYLFFRFYIKDDELIIKKGWLKKQILVVPLRKVQAVHIEASLIHRLLRVVKISVDTAGSEKTEVVINALRRPMAEELKAQLGGERSSEEIAVPTADKLLLRLSEGDILRLSLSANHLEAFVLLLSFSVGLYDNLKDIGGSLVPDVKGLLPGLTGLIVLGLVVALLVVTIFISTVRIFLKYYGLTVVEKPTGFSVRSGLTNVKEKLVPFTKIQAVSWKANWIRKRLGLYIFEYGIAGHDEAKKAQRVQVPLTDLSTLPPLMEPYSALPDVSDIEAIHIDPSYISRRFVVMGLLPAAILLVIAWYWWGLLSLLFLVLPLLVFINATLYQKKFRLWALQEVGFIQRGKWGMEKVLLQWHKVQTVGIKQSLFQQKNNLATLVLYTASGRFVIPYVNLEAARNISDYCLYKIESNNRKWM